MSDDLRKNGRNARSLASVDHGEIGIEHLLAVVIDRDGCVVEAGLYVTPGTVVTTPDGSTMKAKDLSGVTNMLFRRRSTNGVVEVLPRSGSTWQEGLNAALHTNQ